MAQIDVNILGIMNVFSHRMILVIYETLLPVHRLVVELLYGLVFLKVPNIANIILIFKIVSWTSLAALQWSLNNLMLLLIVFNETVRNVARGGITGLRHLHVINVWSLMDTLALLGIQ